LVALDRKIAEVDAEPADLVRRTDTTLPELFGIGPVGTAMVLGEVGDVVRFRTRHHFASYNASAPDDKGSAGHPAHGVNLKGNRRLNQALHIVAVTQIATTMPGRGYYERKRAEGKTRKEALRRSSAGSPMPSTDRWWPTPGIRRVRVGKWGRLRCPA
jgi:transposase